MSFMNMDNQYSSLIGGKTCRLCGLQKPQMFDLYSPNAMQIGLLAKINTFLPKDIVCIDIGDPLPKLICSECKMTIFHFYEFSRIVEKAQSTYYELLSRKKTRFIDGAKCHTTGISSKSHQVLISVGGDLKIVCEECQTCLEVKELATLHLVTHGLGSVICRCRDCGHRDEIGLFLQSNADSIQCPQCLFSSTQTSHINTFIAENEVKTSKNVAAKTHVCDVCSKSFSHKGHRDRHRMIHDGLRPYLCDTCGCGFNQRSSLKIHILSHTKLNPYVCEWCQQSFRFKTSLHSHVLNMHSLVSQIKKSHECDQCEKKFATVHKLRRHYRCHSGERPFQCTICNRSFSQLVNLKSHIQKHEAVDDFDESFTSNPEQQDARLDVYHPQPIASDKSFIPPNSADSNRQSFCLVSSDNCSQSDIQTDILNSYPDTYSSFIDQPQSTHQKILSAFPSLHSNTDTPL